MTSNISLQDEKLLDSRSEFSIGRLLSLLAMFWSIPMMEYRPGVGFRCINGECCHTITKLGCFANQYGRVSVMRTVRPSFKLCKMAGVESCKLQRRIVCKFCYV